MFSIVDAPIHLDKLDGESGSVLQPSDYKFSTTPPSVHLRLKTDDPKVATRARLVASVVAADSATKLGQDDRVLAYLREHPDREFSGRQLKDMLSMAQSTVGASLKRLLAAKQVEQRRVGGAEHNARLWRLATAAGQPAPSATPSPGKRR